MHGLLWNGMRVTEHMLSSFGGGFYMELRSLTILYQRGVDLKIEGKADI